MLKFGKMFSARHCVIFFLLFIVGSVSAQDPRVAQEIYENAVALHQAGQIEAAIREYERFLQEFPGVADVHTNLGAAYAARGDHASAIAHYQRALDLGNASSPDAIRFNLGLAYYKSARFDLAAPHFEMLLTSEEAGSRAVLLLGDCYFRRGLYGEVIRLLDPRQDEFQDEKAFLYLLGTSLLYDGQVLRGQKLVDRIFEQGDSAEAHLLLGDAYLKADDYPAAAEQFERALEMNPTLPRVNAAYARVLREMSRIDEAVPYFRRELELDPHHFDANLHLGIYLYKNEQAYDEALRHFDTALKVRPGNPDARFHQGLVYLLQGDLDRSLEVIQGVVDDVPEYVEGHVTLTRIYYRKGDKEKAEHHRRLVEELRAERDESTLKKMPDGGER